MDITIFYGMSGAMKGATIESLKVDSVMKSSIKSWKYYQFGLFKDKTEYNDLTYGILHLTKLREFMNEVIKKHPTKGILIERGITDCMFYHYYNDESSESEDASFINDLVKEEIRLLLPDFFEVKKTLLIQKDREFVKNNILSDEYRRKTFNNDPDLYFKLQDIYVNFTKKYNKIDNVIEITNAKDYIINILGNEWKN